MDNKIMEALIIVTCSNVAVLFAFLGTICGFFDIEYLEECIMANKNYLKSREFIFRIIVYFGIFFPVIVLINIVCDKVSRFVE